VLSPASTSRLHSQVVGNQGPAEAGDFNASAYRCHEAKHWPALRYPEHPLEVLK
jgi:hypothetical protein